MGMWTKDAHLTILQLSSDLEVLLFDRAKQVARSQEHVRLTAEHVTVALEELLNDPRGTLSRLTQSIDGKETDHVERRAG